MIGIKGLHIFDNAGRSSFIDATFCSTSLSSDFVDWEITPNIFGSFHQPILFEWNGMSSFVGEKTLKHDI